jgi:hypothetical protein
MQLNYFEQIVFDKFPIHYYSLLLDQIQSIQKSWPFEYSGSGYKEGTNEKESFTDFAHLKFILQKAGNKDDILTIVPDIHSDGYFVKYDQKTLLNMTENVIEDSQLVPYLERFLLTLRMDAEPYTAIQVDCPLHPTVWITIDRLRSYVMPFLEQVRSIRSSWPFETSGNDMERRHTVYEYV